MHSVKSLLLWGDCLEVGQSVQFGPVIDSSTVEYVFTTHEIHVSGPVITPDTSITILTVVSSVSSVALAVGKHVITCGFGPKDEVKRREVCECKG
jgi:hypothetical protein